MKPIILRYQPIDSDDILDKYNVGDITVYIVERNGLGYYFVDEPVLSENDMEIYRLLIDELIYLHSSEESLNLDAVKKLLDKLHLKADDLGRLMYFIERDRFGYGVLDVLFRDPNLEEISYTGYGKPVYVIHRIHSEYNRLKTNIIFDSKDEVDRYVVETVHKLGGSISTYNPYIDLFKDNVRFTATYGDEISLPSSTFDVRKFPENPLTLTYLIRNNMLSSLMVSYLWILIEAKAFIINSGPMASGKTTLLSALLNFIPPDYKICSVEDTPEVYTYHDEWLRLKSRKASYVSETAKNIDLFDLVIISLRHRPDYLIVGEVRGEEIRALFQAAALGHGCLTTFHGYGSEYTLIRMSAPPLNISLTSQILIWSIVNLTAFRRGEKLYRRVLNIDEVDPNVSKGNILRFKNIFGWDARDDVFHPDSPDEVVGRSIRLGDVMRVMGWDEDKLVEELNNRMSFLDKLVSDKVFDHKDLVKMIMKFYGGVGYEA